MALIFFYIQTELHLASCRERLWALWGNNRTNFWSISNNVYNYLKVRIEVALIRFYSLMYLRLAVSELYFERSWVVNGLIVSVPRYFLNGTNTIYITHVTCANTWKSQLKLRFIPEVSVP